MELFSTNNLLEEELIIHNNLTGNDFDLDKNKGQCIILCLLFWTPELLGEEGGGATAIPGIIGLIC